MFTESELLKGSLICCVLLVLVLVDLLTRQWCFRVCGQGDFFGFGLHPFKNSLFAFSLPVPGASMYAVYTLVCFFLVLHLVRQWGHMLWLVRFSWLLILVGALDNIGERLALGYVRDFIQVGSGYLNLADVYILAGVGYLLYRGFVSEGVRRA